MNGSSLGLLVEGLVAGLLLVTIGYCMLLNRRLKRLRADEASLRATIAELVHATEIAERAITGFKETAAECDRNLSNKLRQADRFSRSIEKQVELGGKVLNRLSRISELARSHGLVERGDAPAAPAARPQQAGDVVRPVAMRPGHGQPPHPGQPGGGHRDAAGAAQAPVRPQARAETADRPRPAVAAGMGGRAA